MKNLPRMNPFIGFIIVFLITIFVSIFGFNTLRARDNADDVAFQSSAILTQVDEVLLGLVNMETGLRGYLLTGSNLLLEHYYTGNSQYEAALAKLFTLTKDSPSLVARWNTIEKLEKQWDNNWAVKGIQIRKDFDAGKVSNDALSSHAIAERDETVMDAIRAQLDAGKQEVTSNLVQQIQVGQQANYQAYDVMVAGMAVSLILGLLTGTLLNRANVAKTKQIELQHLLLEEREKERLQLARELHDGPVQELLAMSYSVQGLLMENTAPAVAEPLKTLKATIQSVVHELRASAMELRSPTLTKFGLQKAICADIENYQQNNPQIAAKFDCQESENTLSEVQQAALFRVYQEAMRNVIRHSNASQVNIAYKIIGREVILTIQDNGSGFALPDDWLTLAHEGHFGLVGIRERAEAIGGRLEIHSKPNEGTLLRVIVPVDEKKAG